MGVQNGGVRCQGPLGCPRQPRGWSITVEQPTFIVRANVVRNRAGKNYKRIRNNSVKNSFVDRGVVSWLLQARDVVLRRCARNGAVICLRSALPRDTFLRRVVRPAAPALLLRVWRQEHDSVATKPRWETGSVAVNYDENSHSAVKKPRWENL